MRVQAITAHGVPNYFGEQRFGHGGDNIRHARAMLAGSEPVRDRHLRGLYLSAARAFLFNEVLAARIGAGTWNTVLPGEACMLAGSNSFFQRTKRLIFRVPHYKSGEELARDVAAARARAK